MNTIAYDVLKHKKNIGSINILVKDNFLHYEWNDGEIFDTFNGIQLLELEQELKNLIEDVHGIKHFLSEVDKKNYNFKYESYEIKGSDFICFIAIHPISNNNGITINIHH